MVDEDGVVPGSPKMSSDTDEGFPATEEDVDHAQSAPTDDDEGPGGGPSIAGVERSGG